MASKLSLFLAELKRRRVYRVAAVYSGIALAIALGFAELYEVLLLPDWTPRLVVVLLLLGFPVALLLAWAYEIKPEEPRKMEDVAKGDFEAPGSEPMGSIAVLPFTNMSDDPEAEYFSDGMTEEIINALAQLEGLRVAARTSSFSFKGKAPEIAEVGAKLKVETILEGSVRKAGGRLRITAQLVKVTDGFHLWSERYDRQLEDVFAVQDEIARAIADKLKVSLAVGTGEPLVKPPTGSLEAYDLYLKGRFFVTKGGDGTRVALDYFQQALARDPEYALAHAGAAEAYAWFAGTGIVRPKEVLPKAREAAIRALELDGTLAESHLQMGLVAWTLDFDWTNAGRRFVRALELDPELPQLHSLYGFFLASLGRIDESLSELRRGVELDPLSQIAHIWLGQVLAWLKRFSEAIDRLQSARELDPTSWNANHILGMAYRLAGDHPEAMEAFRDAMASAGRHPWSLMELALALMATGSEGQAEAIYDELAARWRADYVPPSTLSFVSATLGRTDEAFEWLDRAIEEHDSLMTWINLLPHFDPLRGDPRFPVLVERVGLDPADSRHGPSNDRFPL